MCPALPQDVPLVKVLKQIPEVTAWKIEGRKKSPHYVFYTVKAYKMLRDEGHDPQKRKIALSFLDYAMGRKTTHYHFLPQRKINPLDKETETGSGLFIGRVRQGRPSSFFITREPLFPGDLLRLGYEDAKGHSIRRITRAIPKKGKYTLPKGSSLPKDAPVFLIDRKEPEIMNLIRELSKELSAIDSRNIRPVAPEKEIVPEKEKINPQKKRKKTRIKIQQPVEMLVARSISGRKTREEKGVWVQPGSVPQLGRKQTSQTWWWLPPVVWPDREEELRQAVENLCQRGARRFVLNMIWQMSMFPEPGSMDIWAGPFCNITNSAAVANLKGMGFSGAMISPELGSKDVLSLPSNAVLPLGAVIHGNWPLCISRIIGPGMKPDTLFTSPRKEGAWISPRWDSYWIFPQWELDITAKQKELQTAGYKKFVTLTEPVPPGIEMKKRPGLWNWNASVL